MRVTASGKKKKEFWRFPLLLALGGSPIYAGDKENDNLPKLDMTALAAIPLEYIHNYEYQNHVYMNSGKMLSSIGDLLDTAVTDYKGLAVLGSLSRGMMHGGSEICPLLDERAWKYLHWSVLRLISSRLSPKTVSRIKNIARGISQGSPAYILLKEALSADEINAIQHLASTLNSEVLSDITLKDTEVNDEVDYPSIPRGPYALMENFNAYWFQGSNRDADDLEPYIRQWQKHTDVLRKFDQILSSKYPQAKSYAAVELLYGENKTHHQQIQGCSPELSTLVMAATGLLEAELVGKEILSSFVEGVNQLEATYRKLESKLPFPLIDYWKQTFLQNYGQLVYFRHQDPLEKCQDLTFDGVSKYVKSPSKISPKDFYVLRVIQAAKEYSDYRQDLFRGRKAMGAFTRDFYGELGDVGALALEWLANPSHIQLNVSKVPGDYDWRRADSVPSWTSKDTETRIKYRDDDEFDGNPLESVLNIRANQPGLELWQEPHANAVRRGCRNRLRRTPDGWYTRGNDDEEEEEQDSDENRTMRFTNSGLRVIL